MAGENTASTLSGLFKDVYGDQVENLLPEMVSIAKDVAFVDDDQREGDVFNQPVILSREQGWTLSAAGGTAFTLNATVASTMKEAQVNGAEFVLRSAISYGAAAKAMNGGKRAFRRAVDVVVENMLETAHWVRELNLLYGNGGSGASGGGLSNIGAVSTNDGATTPAIVLTSASFAPGIWAGSEGMFVDCYDDDYNPKRNISNTMYVSAVNIETKTITFTGTESETDTIVANDVFHLKGGYQNEMTGIDAIVTNTGSLFGITASSYSMWQGTSYSCSSAAVTFAKILRGLNQGIARGLQEPVNLYCSIYSWSDLMNDLAALRRYTENDSKLELGANEITYQGASGPITVKPHLMVKGGEAFALPIRQWERVGATDVTFKLPGSADNFFKELADAAGYEMRCYFKQGIFCKRPARCVKFTNITNST